MKTSKTGPRLKKPGGEGLLRASPFLLPSLIGLAIFYLAPMVVSIFISLTDWNGLDRLCLRMVSCRSILSALIITRRF